MTNGLTPQAVFKRKRKKTVLEPLRETSGSACCEYGQGNSKINTSSKNLIAEKQTNKNLCIT